MDIHGDNFAMDQTLSLSPKPDKLEEPNQSEKKVLRTSYASESEEEEELGPPRGTRLAPVGANDEDLLEKKYPMKSGSVTKLDNGKYVQDLTDKIKQMEGDQEELSASLIAITSHFAKVQFRLQQVLHAPDEARESLLKDLENFAFRSIPRVSAPKIPDKEYEDYEKDEERDAQSGIENEKALILQRRKQSELINQLKCQLYELETYAYESGDGVLPSNVLLERQRIVMDQLKAKLNFNLENIDKLTDSELKDSVDEAVRDIVNPLKMKSHLVNQLKTQIADLEMFIEFLQHEVDAEPCGCKKHNDLSNGSKRRRTPSEREEIRAQTVSLLERAMTVMQLAAVSQFGCSMMASQQFMKNSLKETAKGNHYGDLRARLELSVDRVLETCSQVECITDTDCTSIDSTESPEQFIDSPKVTQIVRRELAVAIRDLMHHGMIQYGRSGGTRVVPFLGCTAPAASRFSGHPWNVILRYYDVKGGKDYNSATSRKLSQSFGLDLDVNSINPKQSLLTTIGSILASHDPYKRSPDARFKAFISAGLNQRKLIPWLKLIVRNQQILEMFYQPWSYAVKTGFDDAFRSLERLTIYGFNLPVDVAVKQFQDMSEAF